MARILYGSMVDEIKGSIGGLSFQRNSAGTIARLKPSRVQSPNQAQQSRMSEFSAAANAWHALSDGGQNAWGVYAATYPKLNYWGESKNLSGYNWFQSLYANALTIGETPRTTPPADYNPLAVPDMDLNYSTSFIDFETPSFDHSNSYLVVFCTPPIFSRSTKDRSKIRLIKVFPPGTETEFYFEDEWKAIFGFSALPDPATEKFTLLAGMATIHESNFYNSAMYLQNICNFV